MRTLLIINYHKWLSPRYVRIVDFRKFSIWFWKIYLFAKKFCLSLFIIYLIDFNNWNKLSLRNRKINFFFKKQLNNNSDEPKLDFPHIKLVLKQSFKNNSYRWTANAIVRYGDRESKKLVWWTHLDKFNKSINQLIQLNNSTNHSIIEKTN